MERKGFRHKTVHRQLLLSLVIFFNSAFDEIRLPEISLRYNFT